MPDAPAALTLYGIPNCDTVRRARRRLDELGIGHRFHDFRRDGLPPALLDGWLAALGHAALLNTRGTSWRALPEAERRDVDAPRARALMLAQPALIRRPVLVRADGALRVGWDETALAPWLAGG